MEHVSLASTDDLLKLWKRMRTWRNPTYSQLMDYLNIYSELSIRNEV